MPIPLEVPLLPLPPPLLPLTTTNTSPSTPCVPCQNVNKHTQTATGTATGSCTCRRTAPTHHKTQARAAISRRFPRQVASGKWQARHAEVFPALSVRTRRCRRQHVQSSSVRSEFKTDVKSTRVRDYAYAALAIAAPIRSLFLCKVQQEQQEVNCSRHSWLTSVFVPRATFCGFDIDNKAAASFFASTLSCSSFYSWRRN